MFHLFHMFHRAPHGHFEKLQRERIQRTKWQLPCAVARTIEVKRANADTWPVLTAHISCPSLYAPYHSSPKIHAYINSKFIKIQRRSKHPLAPITLKSGLVANVHLWPSMIPTSNRLQYLGPGIFRKRFTSDRQMHSRMDETWLSGYDESWGSRDLYFGHASIILTQNEEVLIARVTLSGSNWKENPLHLIDASRSAGLIFRLMFYEVAFSTFQTGSAVQS